VNLRISRFSIAAAAVISVATITLAVLSWGGFYYQDDFMFLRMAHDSSLTVSYLGQGAFGHFFPGFRAAFWALDRTVRLNHDVAVVVVALLHLASLAAMYRLLVLLFGRRPGTLALLGMFGLSGLWLSGYLWWVSALQVMPAMLLTIIAIDAHVRYLVERRGRYLLIAPGALLISLLFYEKPAQLVVLLPLLTVLAFSSSASLRVWLRELASAWRMWTALAMVVLVYVMVYLTGDYFVATIHPSLDTMARTVAIAWHQAFVPALLGGPLEFRWNGSLGLPDPSRLLTIVDQVVILAAVGLSLRRRPAAWRGWAFLLAAFAVNVSVIAWTRSGVFGVDIGRELKYLIDILPYAIVGLGIAFMPLQVGPRAEVPSAVRTSAEPALRILLCAAALAFLTLCAISGVRVGRHWHDGDSARFARMFLAAVARERPSDANTVFFDADVPGTILASQFQPYQRHSVLLELFDTRLRYAGQATRTVAVAPDGAITPYQVSPQMALRVGALTVDGDSPGRSKDGRICVPQGDAPRSITVPFKAPLPVGRPYLRLIAQAPRGARVYFPQQAGIEIGAIHPAGRVQMFPIDASGRPLYVPLDAPGAKALNLVVVSGGPVCLERGYAGSYQPTATPQTQSKTDNRVTPR
jgi:hypothetical protein